MLEGRLGGQVNTPSKQTEVSQEFNNLRQIIDLCEEQVKALGERLTPIRTSKAEKASGECAPEKQRCGLASEIRSNSARIASIVFALKTINMEIEL